MRFLFPMVRGEQILLVEFCMCDELDDSVARTSDPLSSHQALGDAELCARISDHILRIAFEAGAKGITINECAAQMPEYKAWSVSPMFAPLVRKGRLARRVIGNTGPTSRWPEGKEILETRVDAETHKHCTVNYHHAFAPKKPLEAHIGPQQQDMKYDAS
jgi:hypothetical protein